MSGIAPDGLVISPTPAVPAITPGYMLDVRGNVRIDGDLDVTGTITGITAEMVADETLVDIDFAALANNTFADGVEVIAGVSWTAANAAATNTWEIANGTGLRFNANTTNTVYTNASRTAANLAVPILSLIPGFDPLRTYVIDLFFSSVTLGTSLNRFFAGFLLDAAGTDRLMGGGRRNGAGTQQTYSQVDASINGDTATDDAFGIRCDNRGVFTASGTMGADFPAPYPRLGGTFAVPDSFNGPLDPTQGQIVLAWPTGEAGGAMDCTLRRMRIRRIAA